MAHVLITSKEANVLTKSDQNFLLGETHLLKPPILARTHSNHLHEVFCLFVFCFFFLMTGDPGKEHGTKKAPQQGEFRKGQKVTLHVQTPPRILPTGIRLG